MLVVKWGKCWPSASFNPPPRHACSSHPVRSLLPYNSRYYAPVLQPLLIKMPDVTAADPSGTYIRSSELHIHAGT